VFARVAAAATFFLVISGGIVTSTESGLAVPDWPTSFGANMFLLPFSKMLSESQVYYEHAHRLIGFLVGTTTAALGVFLWRTDPRRWMRRLGGVLILAVVAQAVMGGIRVRMASEGVETAMSLAFRVAHGVSGQLFFAGVLALAAFSSQSWRTVARAAAPTAGAERRIALLLLLAALGQLLLGALLRHISREWLLPHIGGAVVVGALAVLAAVRATGLYPTCAPLRATGLALLFLVIGQSMLGFFALAVTGSEVRGGSRGALETLVATAHQAIGALVLGSAALLLVWVHRSLVDVEVGASRPPPTPT
jgi:cytochrome c oxidase assembly protein subunit 15